MADILFTHSYFLAHDAKEHRAMMPYPPLGTLYAAAHARSCGFSVALFDSMLEADEKEIIPHLDRHSPQFVVIYDDDFNYLTKMCLSRMREAAYTMSTIARDRGCTVIVHGSDPTDNIEGYLGHGAGYVVVGEGERTLGELLEALRGKRDVAAIPGIAYAVDGRIVRTPPRGVETDLDRFPLPARDLVDMERYASLWRNRHGFFSTNIVTTRGCPFHCNWCAKPIYGQVYHSRSPENVAAEMAYLKREVRPDHLWFCDDIFGLKPGWLGAFADSVGRADAAIPFKCLSRADLLVQHHTIPDLKRSGCTTVWLGAESGSQKILDAMEKGTTVEQIREASARLRSHGIKVGFFLQFGYPGETRADIGLTLRMVKEAMPDELGISVSYPLPGTKFYENVRRQLGEKKNWVDSEDLAMMYEGTYAPEFYRALHRLTHKKFRMWQGLGMLRVALTRPSSLNRARVRRIASSAYHAVTLPALEARLERLAGHQTSRSPQP